MLVSQTAGGGEGVGPVVQRLATDAELDALVSEFEPTFAQMIREEAPSVFLWTQYDTLAISKKVQYAARPDEWLWLYDAKPAGK